MDIPIAFDAPKTFYLIFKSDSSDNAYDNGIEIDFVGKFTSNTSNTIIPGW